MARRKITPEADAAATLIYGVQPVRELLDGRPRDVERVFVSKQPRGGVGRLLRIARHAGIPVSHLSREQLEARIGRRGAHQGIAALVAPVSYSAVDEIRERAKRSEAGLVVVVDRVTDPGNLGAILRACAGAGVDGVILSRDGTVGLTGHVLKASAGTAERVPVARDPSPARSVEELGRSGFQAIVLDSRGTTPWDRVDLSGPSVIVVGGEERGPRPGLAAACNLKVAIPLHGGLESLNVAVATGVLLFEARRQRRSLDREA